MAKRKEIKSFMPGKINIKLNGGKQMEKKQSAWIKHLMSVKKEHPKKTLTECMKIAKTSYKKN